MTDQRILPRDRKKPQFVILTRQPDGSWEPSDCTYLKREAEKLTQQARILAGIQCRLFPAAEYCALHPDYEPEGYHA